MTAPSSALLAVEVRRMAAAAGDAPATGALGLGVLLPLAAASGGYFPASWGWGALGLLWVVAVVLVLAPPALTRLELALLLSLAALAGWVFLSYLWSAARTQTVLEGERALVYVGGAFAALLLARRSSYGALLAGCWAAIVLASGYGLLTRLFPERLGTFDPIAGYRLAEPVGYWNGLAVFAAMGTLLAFGLAARSKRLWTRVLAAASLPVLVLTLYFTFSRGGWIALGIGVIAAILFDPRWLQVLATLLALAPGPAVAIVVGARSDALTHVGAPLREASSQGHRLAVVLVGATAATALTALVLATLERRLRLPRAARLAVGTLLAVVVAAALSTVFVRYGSPPTLVRKAYDAFNAPPPEVGTNLNRRLFNLSGSGRSVQWKVAWREYLDHPWLGGGAGSYEQYWLEHRPIAGKIRDAHSLYVEMLGELGPVGLALLLVALAVPLAGAARARRAPLVPPALGAYVTYLAHAGVDWDWELTAVTLAALFCGAAMLAAARSDDEPKPLSSRVRAAAVAGILVLSGAAFVGLVGNTALAKSKNAVLAGRWDTAEAQARKAIRWAPWSAEAWQRLGEAQVATYDPAGARESFRKAIAKDPRNWLLWYELAGVTRGAERRRAALQVVRLNPLSAEAAEMRRVARL